MASLFECEVRFNIENIDAFVERLGQLGAELLYPYEFGDHYYKPPGLIWDPISKNLRIREWKTPNYPTTIYFVRNEIITIDDFRFKRATYSHGKVPLFNGDIDICKSLLNDLGFEFWFTLSKQKARHWKIPLHNFETIAEYIEGLGWSGELEFAGDNIVKAMNNIEAALKVLEIPRKLASYKPIGAIYAEALGLVCG